MRCGPFSRRRLAAFTVAVLACVVPPAAADPPPATPSARLLPISLVDPFTGSTVEIEAGEPVVHVVFFATWCPPCRDELPRLVDLAARWTGRGYRLVIVAVSSRQTAERLRDFAPTGGLDSGLLFDADGTVERAFDVDALPTHVLLDGTGRVVLRAPTLDRELETTIHELMVEHARKE